MITGSEYVNCHNIYDKVDSYDVYKFYLGYDPQPRRLYLSPFRKDNNPSFGLFMGKDCLMHKDFGDSSFVGNCINLVQQLFGLTYAEAIRKIVNDMRLEDNGVRVVSGKPTMKFEKDVPTLIQIVPKRFTALQLAYWNQYGISEDDLKKEDIYAVGRLYVNKKSLRVDEISFAYLFKDGDEEFLKIYSPLSKEFKWISNVPVKRALNLNKLEKKSNIITVAKSKKDKMVLQKLITDVYEAQKEGTEVITPELDEFFDTNYDRKICFFDNDEPGKKANKGLNPLGYDWINIPNGYYLQGIKDPADLVSKYDYKTLAKLLDNKGILMDKELII